MRRTVANRGRGRHSGLRRNQKLQEQRSNVKDSTDSASAIRYRCASSRPTRWSRYPVERTRETFAKSTSVVPHAAKSPPLGFPSSRRSRSFPPRNHGTTGFLLLGAGDEDRGGVRGPFVPGRSQNVNALTFASTTSSESRGMLSAPAVSESRDCARRAVLGRVRAARARRRRCELRHFLPGPSRPLRGAKRSWPGAKNARPRFARGRR